MKQIACGLDPASPDEDSDKMRSFLHFDYRGKRVMIDITDDNTPEETDQRIQKAIESIDNQEKPEVIKQMESFVHDFKEANPRFKNSEVVIHSRVKDELKWDHGITFMEDKS